MDTEPRIEKRAYALRWTDWRGVAREATVDVALNLDDPADCDMRARAHLNGAGYAWACSPYVAAMRVATTLLGYDPTASFSLARTDAVEALPTLAPPCGMLDGAKEYRLAWTHHGESVERAVIVKVERSNHGAEHARYTASCGFRQAFSMPSPYVAAYEAACEHLWRLPAETFTLTDVSP